MKRMFFGFAPLLVACTLIAQDVPEAGTDESLDQEVAQEESVTEEEAPLGQGPAIQEMVAMAEEDVESEQADLTPDLQLQMYLTERGIDPTYDEEKDQIVVLTYLDFDLDGPQVSSDFVNLRQEKMAALLLQAKSLIIENLMTTMSAERIREIPGNPIDKQLEKEIAAINKQRDALQKKIANLDADLKKQTENRDKFTLTDLRKLCLGWASKWVEQKTGAELDLASVDEEKKALYESTMADLDKAIAEEEALNAKAEEILGTLREKVSSGMETLSQMPIYGCTVLQQAEGVVQEDGRYKYRLAVIYKWSGEMQKAAGEILQGRAVSFTPGKKNITAWLNSKRKNGALASWVGPRKYIDSKGNMWFIGIATAPKGKNSIDDNMNRTMAGIQARAEVMFSLYADAYSAQTLTKELQTKEMADGSIKEEFYASLAAKQSEAFKNITISGNSQLFTGVLHHDPSGLDVNVVVYGLNSSSPKRLKEIKDRAIALGIEVNTTQEREHGRQEELDRMFEASKHNEAARAEGRAEAQSDQAKRAAARKAARQSKRAAGKKSSTAKGGSAGRSSKTKGQLKPGTYFIIDDDE